MARDLGRLQWHTIQVITNHLQQNYWNLKLPWTFWMVSQITRQVLSSRCQLCIIVIGNMNILSLWVDETQDLMFLFLDSVQMFCPCTRRHIYLSLTQFWVRVDSDTSYEIKQTKQSNVQSYKVLNFHNYAFMFSFLCKKCTLWTICQCKISVIAILVYYHFFWYFFTLESYHFRFPWSNLICMQH